MGKRLIGSDGALYAGKYGAEITTATVLDKGTFYEITAIGASTAFPAGAEVGYLVQGDGVLALATDDTAKPFEGNPLCEITSWNMDFSKAEVDVSTFCDDNKVYRASKYDDITGTTEGIMIDSVTDQSGAIMNHFVAIADETSGTYTISPKDGDIIIAQLYTDDSEETDGVISFYFLPIVLTGFSASAGGDEAQTFSSPFRAAPSDVGVVYYRFPVLA